MPSRFWCYLPLCCNVLPVNLILARQETAATSSSDSTRPPLSYGDGNTLKMCCFKVTPGVSQGRWYDRSSRGHEMYEENLMYLKRKAMKVLFMCLFT